MKKILTIILSVSLCIISGCTARGIGNNAKEAVYGKSVKISDLNDTSPLSEVGFACTETEPTDDEVRKMTDEVIKQILGKKGLSAIIKRGDKVVIKVNMVGPGYGSVNEKGRGIISDPRIVKHVAEKVREIIGFENGADLKIIDALFYSEKNPSSKSEKTSFYSARLERKNNTVYYDSDADGFLDGSSKAELVNLDSINEKDRYRTTITEPLIGDTEVYLPKFLRTKEQAGGESDYCDVYIGIPILKSHAFTGITGALKLHYGLSPGILKRTMHHGYGWGTGDVRLLLNYLCAINKSRKFDLVIMDALTGNRKGPLNTSMNLGGYDMRTDYILTNAVLCSKDSVAVDTVETLLAGYNPDSVPLLESAFRDGIGINKPSHIDLKGYEKFHLHKIRLSQSNQNRYPFEDGWGNARTHKDFTKPQNLKIKISSSGGGIYLIDYSAEEKTIGDSGLSRIELLINGERLSYTTQKCESGTFTLNLKKFSGREIRLRIAAWDNVLNCSLSEEIKIRVK